MLSEFIGLMLKEQELTSWTVALIGGGRGRNVDIVNEIRIDMLERSSNTDQEDRYSFGRLLSPRDEAIDLDEPAWVSALAETQRLWRADPARMQKIDYPEEPIGPAIRKIRGFGGEGVAAHPERGLLLLYVLDPMTAGLPEDTPPAVAFGISFPASKSGQKVEYKVNNVLWEMEYGPAE